MPESGSSPTLWKPLGLVRRSLGKVPRPVVLGGLLALVSVVSALFLSAGLSGRQLPQLSETDLGRPFRASSVAGFKASRDFEVSDEATTQKRREAARELVRPVFDFDPSVESKVRQGVREAFRAMREAADDYFVKHPQLDASRPLERGTKEERELLQTLSLGRGRFEAHAVLPDDEDFEVLAQARFSPDIEQAVVSLVELAYRARIVASRDELSRIDANGITVRLLGGNSEYPMNTAQPEVMDLREVAAELDRFASVPGNLLPEAPVPSRRAALRLARKQVRVNLTVNIAETEARRKQAWESVKPVVVTIKRGQRLIGDGELISEGHLLLLRSLKEQQSEFDLLQVQLGGMGIVALLVAGAWLFFTAAMRRFRPTRRDAAFMALLGLVLEGTLHLWVLIAEAVHDRYPAVPVEALHFLFPMAAGAMLVRFVLAETYALFFTIVFAAIAGLMLGGSMPAILVTLLGSLVAADRIARAKDRAGIFRAGLAAGVASLGLVFFLGLVAGKGLGVDSLLGGSFALVSAGFVAPMLVLALTPLAESAFGYASDIKLLELANLNHPALKELVLNAPGTYHHSIVMGSLVEAAAEAIGANPLLARSCAYYHDIGKGRNPAFFGENQKGENPHDSMSPAASAEVIIRHVTEGQQMALDYKLPQRVAAAIPEHHGTRLVGFFFHKALKEAEARGEAKESVSDAAFRYPGPRPQSRETALVMIADACEAASRSMATPDAEKLRALVQRMINLIFSEGQLDECELTLKDLNLITGSFANTLEGIYHARPAYPPGAVGGGRAPTSEVVKSPLTVVKGDAGTKRAVF